MFLRSQEFTQAKRKSSAALLCSIIFVLIFLCFDSHIYTFSVYCEKSLWRDYSLTRREFFFLKKYLYGWFFFWDFFFEKKYELFKIRRMRKLKINYSMLNQLLLKLLPDWSVLITNRRVLPRIFHRHVAELTDLRKCLFFYF